MKAYWKNHPALRMVLMLVLFVLALVLVVSGWKMTGQLAGLGIMLVGVALLLAVLALYNAAFFVRYRGKDPVSREKYAAAEYKSRNESEKRGYSYVFAHLRRRKKKRPE